MAEAKYKVVTNGSRYAVQPAEQKNPDGWQDAGLSGTQAECQDYVKFRENREQVVFVQPPSYDS